MDKSDETEKKTNLKLDISSTAIEKGFDIAKNFLEKLISPAIEETGLLLKDQIALWRFRRQINMLGKAKELCEKYKIKPKAISLKLLVPLLENSSLEEDEVLQDKWAILLTNLVDSNQNIENNVFPYILSQISRNEFEVIEALNKKRIERIKKLRAELEIFLMNKPIIIKQLEEAIARNRLEKEARPRTREWSIVNGEGIDLERKLRDTNYREIILNQSISKSEEVGNDSLKEFEISNLTRLGIIREVQNTLSSPQQLEIPMKGEGDYSYVEFDVDVETEQYYILTQLGELFLDACTPKEV